MSPNSIRIDNADARVVYEGPWLPEFNDTNAWNKTLTLTRGLNSSASISFTGNRIVVYGVLSKTAPHMTKYNLDDTPPETLSTTPSARDATGSVPVYQSPPLPYGKHALTITNMKEMESIWLDYFEVSTLGAGSSTATPSPFTAPTANQPNPRSSHGGPSAGGIIGASIAGLAVAGVLVGLIILLVRRKQQRTKGSVLPQHVKTNPPGYLSRVDTNLSDVSSLGSTVDGR